MPRELHLLAFGNTRSAGPWRHLEIDNSPAGVRRRLIARTQTAEAGGFDAVFFADGLNYGPPATWAYKARILGDWPINGTDPLPNLANLGRGGQGN